MNTDPLDVILDMADCFLNEYGCNSQYEGAVRVHEALLAERQAAAKVYSALVMVRDADEDCVRDALPVMPGAARDKIDVAIACYDAARGQP